jgi:hypothetical protein
MAIQYDFFEDSMFDMRDEKVVVKKQIENLKEDIDKMRKSFFARLNGQERKYNKLLDKLDEIYPNEKYKEIDDILDKTS